MERGKLRGVDLDRCADGCTGEGKPGQTGKCFHHRQCSCDLIDRGFVAEIAVIDYGRAAKTGIIFDLPQVIKHCLRSIGQRTVGVFDQEHGVSKTGKFSEKAPEGDGTVVSSEIKDNGCPGIGLDQRKYALNFGAEHGNVYVGVGIRRIDIIDSRRTEGILGIGSTEIGVYDVQVNQSYLPSCRMQLMGKIDCNVGFSRTVMPDDDQERGRDGEGK